MKGFIPNIQQNVELASEKLNNSFVELGVKQDCEKCNCSDGKCEHKNN